MCGLIGWIKENDAFCKKNEVWDLQLLQSRLDKAPRLSISIVIWILSSDADTIFQLYQFNTNSEAAMLSSHTPQTVTNTKKGKFAFHCPGETKHMDGVRRGGAISI